MNRSSYLTVFALVIWAACLACDGNEYLSEGYLDFVKNYNTDFDRNIAAALRKIVVEDPYASMDWFDDALERAIRETDSETDKEVYSDLSELARGKIEGRLWKTFQSIRAQADYDPNSGLKPWKDYLTRSLQLYS